MPLTETQKVHFLNNIDDEYFLLDDVLIPLFTNMKTYHKVIKTHGADEKGKDIVLVEKSPLGQLHYTAVIVKNESITNASQKREKEIVATVINQILMCLNSGFDSIEEKKKVHFHDIMVVTSCTISNSARQAFVDEAILHHFTGMVFWEDRDLMKYIDEHLPEIYLVSSGSLSKYFHGLKEKCGNMNELKKIAIYKGEDKKLSDIYIEPKLVRRVDRVEDGVTKSSYEDSVLGRLISKGGRYLVTGSAGSGKSTLLRSEIGKLIIEYENEKRDTVPFFIKIKNLVKGTNFSSDVADVLNRHLLEEFSLDENDVQCLAAELKNACIFFDGFDEISQKQEIDFFYRVLDYLESNYNMTIVVSSRKSPVVAKENFKGYEEWRLSDFSVQQIRSFFDKWFRGKSNHLLADLKDHDLLEKLPNTPLVMTLIAIIFESDQSVEIPSNLSELYKMFIELLVGRWNLDRRVDTMYKANDKESFLKALAVHLHNNEKLACAVDELLGVFEATSKKLGRTFDLHGMLDELVKDTNLIFLNENDEYEFRHLSFQEYLVAENLTVKNEITKLVKEFPHPWWDQVIYFYCGIRKDNDDILPLLFEKIAEQKPRERLLSILHMGYLIQSSYQTDAELRKSLVAKLITDYAINVNVFAKELFDVPNFPDILKYLTLLELFRSHYRSRFMDEIYAGLVAPLVEQKIDSFEKAYALFTLLTVIAANGNIDVLADHDHSLREFPMVLLMEDYFLRSDLLEDKDAKDVREKAKEMATEVRKRIRKNLDLYKKLIKQVDLKKDREGDEKEEKT